MTTARAPRGPATRARADARTKKGGLSAVLTTDLGEATFHPLPVTQWRSSARFAVQHGDDRTWAEKVLPAREYKRWLELDPNLEEFVPFIKALMGSAGEDLGESNAST